MGKKKFDKVIDSIDGEIGLNEIEDLVEDTLFHA